MPAVAARRVLRVPPSRTGTPFLQGSRVLLRPLTISDLSGPYARWLNDYEVTRFLETGAFPTTKQSLERYFHQVAQQPDNVLLAIIERATSTHIGNIKLGPIHSIHRRADLGILVGEKRVWGRGYGGEAIELMLAYGFDRLNLHKITLRVYANHHAAVKLYQKLGFIIEGTLQEQLFRDGTFHDKYVMGLLEQSYRTRRSARAEAP